MDPNDFYCLHSELCKTLANATRQHIIDLLREGELTVGDIVSRTGGSQANVSQHLALMRAKGIVNARREGSYAYYSIANRKIFQAFDLISEVMRESLESRNRTVDDAVGRPSNG